MHHAAHGRLSRCGPFRADPDRAEDLLRVIKVGTACDITHVCPMPDPEELLQNRRKMALMMARHFRIPPDHWRDMEVAEMVAWYRDGLEIAAEERASIETG